MVLMTPGANPAPTRSCFGFRFRLRNYRDGIAQALSLDTLLAGLTPGPQTLSTCPVRTALPSVAIAIRHGQALSSSCADGVLWKDAPAFVPRLVRIVATSRSQRATIHLRQPVRPAAHNSTAFAAASIGNSLAAFDARPFHTRPISLTRTAVAAASIGAALFVGTGVLGTGFTTIVCVAPIAFGARRTQSTGTVGATHAGDAGGGLAIAVDAQFAFLALAARFPTAVRTTGSPSTVGAFQAARVAFTGWNRLFGLFNRARREAPLRVHTLVVAQGSAVIGLIITPLVLIVEFEPTHLVRWTLYCT